MSLGSVPPYNPLVGSIPPSPNLCPAGSLIGALPNIKIPPQSPAALPPIPPVFGLYEVKTIGCVCVPSAIILAPRVITKAVAFPLIIVPGSIVRVALLVTYTNPPVKV